MITTTGTITTEVENQVITDTLMAYSEEEKQENAINAANAKLVFQPKFIAYYPKIKKDHNLTILEAIIYGFIEFYLSESSSRFWFSNKSIGEMIGCDVTTASKAITKLSKIGLIKTSHKVMADGGTRRYITAVLRPDLVNSQPPLVNSQPIYNNINNTKDIVSKDTIQKSLKVGVEVNEKTNYGNQDISRVLKEFTEVTGLSQPVDAKPRQWAWLFIKNKGVENFRPCLVYLQKVWGDRVRVTKIEQVYRNFPVYEAEVIYKPKVKSTKVIGFGDDGTIIIED